MSDHLQLALDRLSALLGTMPDKVAFSDELHFLTVDETIVGQGPDALAASIDALFRIANDGVVAQAVAETPHADHVRAAMRALRETLDDDEPEPTATIEHGRHRLYNEDGNEIGSGPDLLVDYTQALALAVSEDAADSLPGGRARLANARGGTFLFAEEGDTVQWDEPLAANAQPNPTRYVVIQERRYPYGPASTFPVLPDGQTSAAIEHGTVSDLIANAKQRGDHVLEVGCEAMDQAELAVQTLRLAELYRAATGPNDGAEQPDLRKHFANAKPDVGAPHQASMSHEEVMVALAMSGALCEACPGPWEVVREDEYRGPGTAHVWGIYAASGAALVTLPADIDGPSFVAWVNHRAPVDVSLSGSGELRISERPRPPEQHTETAQGFARIADLLLGPDRQAYTDSIVAAVQQLIAERDSLRRTLASVQRERDGLAQAYAVAKENEA